MKVRFAYLTKRKKNTSVIQGMRFGSSMVHFLGSTLFLFKYCSIFFYLRMVYTYFHSSISHLERFRQDGEFSWTVNPCGHLLMVICNKLCQCRGGGWGAKPLLGSVNTVQCQVRGCRGKAPVRISKHCSALGLG